MHIFLKRNVFQTWRLMLDDTQTELHQQEPAIPSDHCLLRLTAQLVYLYSFDLFQNFYNI